MSFQFIATCLKDLVVVQQQSFEDERGFFVESYRESEFYEGSIDAQFVQDNHSYSTKGVVRGLHFQYKPYAQGKLVSVISGEIFDVAVDIRPYSDTFGKWFGINLRDSNFKMLWLPPGFAHGFQAIEDSHVIYKVTAEYHKESEGGIIWNDSSIGIKWPLNEPIVSLKDNMLPDFKTVSGGLGKE